MPVGTPPGTLGHLPGTLGLGRTDPPDVDLDLPADRDGEPPAREAVIQYALNRWSGHAALVANVITFRARLAVREVGLALGLAPEHIDALARDAPLTPPPPLPQGARGSTCLPSLASGRGAAIARSAIGSLRRLHDLCARIEGLPRHLGQHPGGVVITARPLAEVAPLQAMP